MLYEKSELERALAKELGPIPKPTEERSDKAIEVPPPHLLEPPAAPSNEDGKSEELPLRDDPDRHMGYFEHAAAVTSKVDPKWLDGAAQRISRELVEQRFGKNEARRIYGAEPGPPPDSNDEARRSRAEERRRRKGRAQLEQQAASALGKHDKVGP